MTETCSSCEGVGDIERGGSLVICGRCEGKGWIGIPPSLNQDAVVLAFNSGMSMRKLAKVYRVDRAVIEEIIRAKLIKIPEPT